MSEESLIFTFIYVNLIQLYFFDSCVYLRLSSNVTENSTD